MKISVTKSLTKNFPKTEVATNLFTFFVVVKEYFIIFIIQPKKEQPGNTAVAPGSFNTEVDTKNLFTFFVVAREQISSFLIFLLKNKG